MMPRKSGTRIADEIALPRDSSETKYLRAKTSIAIIVPVASARMACDLFVGFFIPSKFNHMAHMPVA
jgi:hypothetical protein